MTVLRFETCKLYLETQQLLVGDQPIDLQPLVFDLLAYLAQNPRRVVKKEELLQAVWRSPCVSDSAIARAVMKCRRAIQDAAASPRWLHTLHGKGYRFDVEVCRLEEPAKPRQWTPEPASLPGALGVLPWLNRTGDSSLDWTCLGLAGLVHHLLDQSRGPALAPMAATTALWPTLDHGADVLLATCEALGIQEALACELHRDQDGWTLRSWRGPSMVSAAEFSVSAGDIVQLATGLAEILAGDNIAHDALPTDPFWREQLAQSIGLHQAGNPRQALALLNLCTPHFRPNAQIMLLKCRMLYRDTQLEACVLAAQQAIELAEREGAVVVGVRARTAMAYALFDLGRLDESAGLAEAALRITEQSPQALATRPRVLCCLTRTVMQQGHAQLAVKHIEEAVALSQALGQLDDEAEALMWAGFVFGTVDRGDRAAAAVERALHLAQRSGSLALQANVLRAQAVVLQWQQQPSLALDACRRSLALWTRTGNQVGRNWAMAHILELMPEAGEDSLFAAEHHEFIAQAGLPVAIRNSARCSHAVWLWKQGQQHAAAGALAALADDIDPAELRMHNQVGEELIFMLAQLGETDSARLKLSRMPKADRPIRRARSQAAVELSAGNSAAATAVLRQIWDSQDSHGLGAVDLLADFAWLLLEQWSPGDNADELESLYAHALDHRPDYLPSAVFRAGWRLRFDPHTDHVAQWDAVMQRASARLRHFTWITAPAYREEWASGQPRPLAVLLTRAFT